MAHNGLQLFWKIGVLKWAQEALYPKVTGFLDSSEDSKISKRRGDVSNKCVFDWILPLYKLRTCKVFSRTFDQHFTIGNPSTVASRARQLSQAIETNRVCMILRHGKESCKQRRNGGIIIARQLGDKCRVILPQFGN